MGVAKRSLSPDEQREVVTSVSEEVSLPAHLLGQRDIRSFCSMKSSCQSGIAPRRVFECAKRGRSNSDAEGQELPLLKLPGQRDVRSYLRPSLCDKYCDAFYRGDEEAAVELGFSLGLDSDDEETEDEKCFREAQESEMEVCQLAAATPWSAAADYFEAAEEAAVAMGLSIGMASSSPADDVEDFLEGFAEDLLMQQHVWPQAADDAARFVLEEEAAQAMGLNLSLDGDSQEEPEMHELELEPEEAIAYQLNGGSYHYKAQEEAADAMGLSLCIGRGEVEDLPHGNAALLERYTFALGQGSEEAEEAPDYQAQVEAAIAMGLSLGLGEADDEEEPELPDMSELEPQPEETKDYQAEEEAAISLGIPLSLGRGHANEQWATDDSDDGELGHVDKKARVDTPVEELIAFPGTPPKRVLAAKTSAEFTPPQDAKRRRLFCVSAAEKLGKDVVVEVKHAQQRPLVTLDAQVLGD